MNQNFLTLGKTSDYYKKNPDARKKKAAYDKKWNNENKSERDEYKRRHAKRRYEDEKNGKDIKGKDYDESVGRYTSMRINRGRSGEGGRKKLSHPLKRKK